HSSRGMEGLCCSALTGKTRGRLETWLEVFSIVRMAHLKAGNIPTALVLVRCRPHYSISAGAPSWQGELASLNGPGAAIPVHFLDNTISKRGTPCQGLRALC